MCSLRIAEIVARISRADLGYVSGEASVGISRVCRVQMSKRRPDRGKRLSHRGRVPFTGVLGIEVDDLAPRFCFTDLLAMFDDNP
ncbi:hypothetical protein J6590_034243 [Homalodisca vitripennis]|nr:hypothetical protein J6590_034243 [Homalodisca vitripennis]